MIDSMLSEYGDEKVKPLLGAMVVQEPVEHDRHLAWRRTTVGVVLNPEGRRRSACLPNWVSRGRSAPESSY
jgi:hypothetical protein